MRNFSLRRPRQNPPRRSPIPRTHVDRGGTFTDVVVIEDDGTVEIRKIPSDRAVVGELARGPLTFGTTVATNALLEGKGAPTLLIVTRGFADLPWIGDMTRPDLFDGDARWPEPLCRGVLEVGGRIDASGHEIEPLVIPDLPLDDVASVAVVLLNSPRNPAHEEAVRDHILARRPDLFVALGHRCAPEIGYLARVETTLVDAAVTPLLQQALARDRIGPDALAMRSDGSLCPAPALRAPDAVLSGPAGGVVAVEAIARQAGFRRAVGLDMGGTSTDVCRVEVGDLPRREGDVAVAGVRIRRPMLEVETIAAGGGSIVWSDGLRLGVGPASAGANPGPQCYGRGGPPTLTDAALLEGLVDPDAFDPPLDPSRVALPGEAREFLDIARDAMAAAIRRIATARGVELHDHALVAFGGAAGQHAACVAERLDIDVVLVHPCASVLAAFGQALAPRAERAVQPIWKPLSEAFHEVRAAWDALLAGLPDLGDDARVVRSVEVRHRGTDHALEVQGDSPEAIRRAFVSEHRKRYGFDRDGIIEVVNAWVRVQAAPPAPPRVRADPWQLGEAVLSGPTVLRSPTTSVLVPAGWTARLDRGLLRLDRASRPRAHPSTSDATTPTPYRVALWGNRFMAVAEQAGAVLQRLARSVNIRERLDFSCAVFDGAGHLVANAPHIPVHLGAMGVTVRDLLAHHPELATPPDASTPSDPVQAWLCNDPAAGGSHLPDLTVITAVSAGDRRWFLACRAHHADVGGITPGSMPPRSSRLDEEGFVARHVPLLRDGRLRDLSDVLHGCRQPDQVRADLEAQIAANLHAARSLLQLGTPEEIDAWMGHLQDVADRLLDRVLARLPAACPVMTDFLDDIPLVLRLSQGDQGLLVDFTGTGGPHPGNLNAPPAVVRAAILFALRVLVAQDIPLNEGVLRRVRILLPEPSIVHPPPYAAVAGGNVETSQRITDLMLRAAGFMAASQGTMNNLTLGGESWTLYETLGGGSGGSPRGPGASARQVHMTNTRATDPEVLEARLPVRVRRFALRHGSGGPGQHPGGNGLIRELEVLAPATAALLATRRREGAPGLEGGEAGLPGRDEVRIGGVWQPWNGDDIALSAGDRVRVATPGGGGWGPSEPS